MSLQTIEQALKQEIADQVQLLADGTDRYVVFTPFSFGDGDELVIVLKRVDRKWIFTDEAHTYMHLSYHTSRNAWQRGGRATLIANALSEFQVKDCRGELIREVDEMQFGEALCAFIQALLQIAHARFLSRERYRSPFLVDVRTLLARLIPEERRIFDWADPRKDPQKRYKIDCYVNGLAQPFFIHALNNNEKTQSATIAMQQFKGWDQPFRAVGIFRDQSKIKRVVLEQFSEVCPQQFGHWRTDREHIEEYVRTTISPSASLP